MTPDEYCQNKAIRRGSSFYYSILFLSEPERNKITALKAFVQEAVDISHECSDPATARVKLDWWRGEIENLFHGRPNHPVSKVLAPVVDELNLQEETFREVIDGVQMDLDYGAYASFADLSLYCYRVSITMTQLSAEIAGYEHRHTRKAIYDLGMGFRLLKVLRNVRTDARRGHIYLPRDEMSAFNISAVDFTTPQTSDNLAAFFEFQCRRIKLHLANGLEALPAEDRFKQLPAIILARLYLVLLREIETDSFRVLEHGIHLTPLRKLWIAWRTKKKEKARLGMRRK